jgi:hypothetical protein
MATGVVLAREIYAASSGFNPELDNRIPIALPVTPVVLAGGAGGVHALELLSVRSVATASSRPAASFEMSDWYFRLHILPASFALGNVVSNEQFTVGVWNAWLATVQTLDTIAPTDATGLVLAGQPVPPLLFEPNQQLDYALEIGPVGPPSIDASYLFTFADAETVELTITGQRVNAWALTPDWTTPVHEKLGFLTDVLIAWSGKEQRRRLRISPRRVFTFTTMMQTIEKRFVENQFFGWSAQIWALPIWPDGQRTPAPIAPGDTTVVADTAHRDFVAGGLALVLTSAAAFEILQVESVAPNLLTLIAPAALATPAGSKLYPVRSARLLAYPRISRESQSLATLTVEFTIVEPCDWPLASGLPIYRGLPVLEDSPDKSAPAEGAYEREATITDNDNSIDVDDTALLGFPTNVHTWWLKGRAARAAFRSLMYTLAGRWQEIWVPSYDNDLQLVEDAASSASNLTFELSGFQLYAGVQNRQDIRIETYAGAIFYRRILGAAPGSPGTEVLTIDSVLGVALPVASVRRISLMALSRLDADEITIEHLTAADGLASASTPFRAVNDNV